ncbi:hypothetical protein QBC39DRAFT_354915 [Podospora conica]|nr:hypothetical protein QBC39DRAFT_354915 [Schizothecium conicum]
MPESTNQDPALAEAMRVLRDDRQNLTPVMNQMILDKVAHDLAEELMEARCLWEAGGPLNQKQQATILAWLHPLVNHTESTNRCLIPVVKSTEVLECQETESNLSSPTIEAWNWTRRDRRGRSRGNTIQTSPSRRSSGTRRTQAGSRSRSPPLVLSSPSWTSRSQTIEDSESTSLTERRRRSRTPRTQTTSRPRSPPALSSPWGFSPPCLTISDSSSPRDRSAEDFGTLH